MSKTKEAWGTRVGLILAMAGNAVGLGNFLRFPVQAVQNGGGAFIIPYLVCFLVMGIPLLWIEWTIGRFGGTKGSHSTPFIMGSMSKRMAWKYFGAFGIFANVVIAAYYCYIESWTMAYVYHSVIQTFSGDSQAAVANFFNQYVTVGYSTTGIPYEAVIFYVLCLSLNMYILSRGLKGGVEKVAKFGVPMLILFGAFLAYRGITMGASGAPEGCTDCDSLLGLNFLWEPQFDTLANPKIWLAAAGQIFFTLSVGMGTIQCYASYVREKDDIALNAMSAGWMNEFVEIVLGASIVIPIAVGYLGLDWVKENAGFAMAFQTMPFLFDQWGPVLSTLAGVSWFGLLFFAAITSSLAMGTPWMGFMIDEFKLTRNKAAGSFGLIVLLVGLPTVFFFHEGVFSEYDYWAGTVTLVVFALVEVILFSYIFGVDKGWEELNRGGDIRTPAIYKPILKYVTPIMLLIIFLSALVTPLNNDWERAFKAGWELDPASIIGKIQNKGIVANRQYFADYFEADVSGRVAGIGTNKMGEKTLRIEKDLTYYRDKNDRIKLLGEGQSALGEMVTFDSATVIKTYLFDTDQKIIVAPGDEIKVRDKVATGSFINNIFYLNMSRLLLVLVLAFICYLVFVAAKGRKKSERRDQ